MSIVRWQKAQEKGAQAHALLLIICIRLLIDISIALFMLFDVATTSHEYNVLRSSSRLYLALRAIKL